MPTPMHSTWTMAGLAALLTLSACGGGGGGNSGGDSGNVLFVADINHGVVAAFPTLDPPAGSTVSGSTISVPLLGPSLAYKAEADELYTASYTALESCVAVYANASHAKGSPSPARTITLQGVNLVRTPVIYLDKTDDVLYIGGTRTYDGIIAAISHASTASGSVTPDRTMTFSAGVNFFTMDPVGHVLYVLNSLSGVHVYQHADTADGAMTQSHGWSSSGTGLAIDPVNDRLYVSDPVRGIQIVDKASSSSLGFQAGTLAIPSAHYVTLDAGNDRLYVGAYTSAYIINNASALGASSQVPAALSVASEGSSIAGFAFP